jgi:hypothetical protein
VRVVAFNTAEGWSRDVSEEIADELARRLASEDREMPAALESFLDRHCASRPAQLPLPLRVAVSDGPERDRPLSLRAGWPMA